MSTRTTARLFNVLEEGSGGAERLDVEETINLDDALLSIAEEAFRVSGLLVPHEGLDRPECWETGDVHARLSPAQLMLLDTRTQIVDPTFFAESVSRSMSAIESMALFLQGLEGLKNKGASDRKKMAKAAAQQLLGMSPDVGREIGEAVRLFFGDQVILRQLPCGDDYRSYAFVGVLATDASLLEDRGAMHAKYGAAASSWTVLAQIGTVTGPITSAEDDEPNDEAEEDFDRAEFERIAANMMIGLEDAGVTGGPRWPTITITPLAVYRSAPAVPEN